MLDLSRILTGPYCTMMLADLGADIIKIEMPGKGDDTRNWGPPFLEGESAYFLSLNRSKKSLTINLKTDMGRSILLALAEKVDAVVENFRPGVAAKLGIDYGTLKEVNPKVVYCSISSYGQTGPYSGRVGYDIVIQAMGGLMGVTGEPNRPPVRIGVAVSDIAGGMFAALAITSALLAREKTGRGRYIDISLLDSTVSWMTYMASNFFTTGESPSPMGSSHPNIVPYKCFETKDEGFVAVAAANDRLWSRLCEEMGVSHLIHDPRFATNPERVRNRKKLIQIFQELFLERTAAEWVQRLSRAGVPCGPVYRMEEVFSDPQVLARQMLLEVDHPKAGRIKQIGFPVKFSQTQTNISSPPLLGEHTLEVLKDELGYSIHEIESMRQEGIV